MTTLSSTPFDSLPNPPWPVRRFTVQEYARLGECGILSAEDRVELLEGWIVPKMNQRPAHRYVVGVLNQWLQQNLAQGFIALCQLPITTERSEPEPDLVVVRGNHEAYRDRHPRGGDCRLVIEVADTSVDRDRLKALIYASAGVTEYWLLNLVDRQLERYTCPAATGYTSYETLTPDRSAELLLGTTQLSLPLGDFFR